MTADHGARAPGTPATLEEARVIIEQQAGTIAQQAAEIARLLRRVSDDRLVGELRDAVRLSVTASAIATPVSHASLLDMIVATAADIIGANAAALFLVDQEQEDLVFEVALGEKADEVKKFRVPLGHGVAGLVALTGQPMAVSDTTTDDRDAADIAEAVGYVPKNILCVPLFYSDSVIGVLELLDKEGAAHFSPDDMEALSLFANQAAVAIEQSRNHDRLDSLVAGFVQSLGAVPEGERASLAERAAEFARGITSDQSYQRALTLAGLVQEISGQGDREWDACRGILESFAQYLRSKPSSGNAGGEMGMPSW